MALTAPAFLDSLRSNIRLRPIPWEGALRAGNLTQQQLSRIEKARVADGGRKNRIESDLDGYRELFVGSPGTPCALETAGKNTEVLQFLLVLMGDLLEGVPQLAQALLKDSSPYQHLLPLIAHSTSSEDPIPLLAVTTASRLMATSRDVSRASSEALPMIFTYLTSLARTSEGRMQDIAVQEFSSLLYEKGPRMQFWAQRRETIPPLVDILIAAAGVSRDQNASLSLWTIGATSSRGAGFESIVGGGVGLQLLYHVLLVMWQMSFDAGEIGNELNDDYDIVVLYTQLLRLSQKEKTSRLIVATLNNLLRKNPTTLLPIAVLARLPALLETLGGRQFTDPDLKDDLQQLRDLLDEYTRTKTTFHEYVAELELGHLRWSPPHRNKTFWAENARRILDHENGSLLRKMAEIMGKPWDNDKQVLAIACSDTGFLVREMPERRYQLEKLGLKSRILELMQDSDESVRWESLQALGSWLKYSFNPK